MTMTPEQEGMAVAAAAMKPELAALGVALMQRLASGQPMAPAEVRGGHAIVDEIRAGGVGTAMAFALALLQLADETLTARASAN